MPSSVEIPDGNNITQGAKGDGAATDNTSSWSMISLLKGLLGKLSGTITVNTITNYAQETGGNLATITTNTTGLATQSTLASAKADLDTIATNLNQLATGDSRTITSIPVFIPGMSNGSTGAERLHSIDGIGDGTTFGLLANGDYLYNGTGWDKARNNWDNITVLASTSR